MHISTEELNMSMGNYNFSAKNTGMTILVQNQTSKKVRPLFGLFLIKKKKFGPRLSPPYTIFFSAPFVFCGRNFRPLATRNYDSISSMCNTGKKSKTMVEERKLDSPKGDAAAVARGQKEKIKDDGGREKPGLT
jgi:hypothetical protein